MSSLRFKDPYGIRVKVVRDAVSTLLDHAQFEPGALEAGGILLGRELVTTGDLVVDTVTSPAPDDVRTTTTFFRSAPLHQRRIHDAWHRSRGTRGYLGEWHTHAEAHPIPSAVDWMDWRRRLVEDEVDARFTLFFIVGTSALGAWVGDRCSGFVRALGYQELPVVDERLRPRGGT